MDQREARRLPVAASRRAAAGAAGLAVALCLVPTAAGADDTVPSAPAGSAEASVLTVGDLIAISRTAAEASGSGGTASAGVVVVNGQPVLGTGGTQQGAGRTGGSLLDTGETPLGRVVVAPWQAEVSESGGTHTARGRAAALEAYVVDEDTASVVLLESTSEASHTGGTSNGSSSSDGAHVRLLGGTVDVTVLHAEASRDGSASYLVKVNGTEIGSDEQLGAVCEVAVPSLVTVGCVRADGGDAGNGTTETAASTVTADVPLPLDTTVTGVSSSSGQATQVKSGGSTRGPGGGSGNASGSGSGGSATSDGAGALPMTGAPAARLGGLAAFALAAGAWLQAATRRRRVTA
ncbi:MAG TPA: hypothetical protein VF519_18610 [Mycobacteriales bacterium]|jgi:hypothetical protein